MNIRILISYNYVFSKLLSWNIILNDIFIIRLKFAKYYKFLVFLFQLLCIAIQLFGFF